MLRGDGGMKIHKRGTRVRVTVSAEELEKMGLSFDILREKGLSALLFIAALRTKISLAGMGEVSGDIRVRKCGGGAVLAMDAFSAPCFCTSQEELAKVCQSAKCEGELYSLGNCYVLTFPDCDRVGYAKIKEHGRLLSRIPVKLINDLYGQT